MLQLGSDWVGEKREKMDIWVVAAAAGAGYVAQHWKNFAKGRKSFSDSSCESPTFRPESSSSNQQAKGENSWPCDVLHGKKLEVELFLEKERLSQDSSIPEIASTIVDCADHYTHSASNLVPGSSSCEDVQVAREGVGTCGDKDESYQDLSFLPSTRETAVSYGFARKKNSLRSRRTNGQSLKPLNSLESCLMAQLFKELAEMGKYCSSSFSSPCTPAVNPFVGADGSSIINRATPNSCNLLIGSVQNKPHTATTLEDIFGAPRLPSLGSMKFCKKAKTDIQMEQHRRSSISHGLKGKHQRLQGTSQGALLFCLGLSLGLISSFLTNKREVDKLSDLLKQTESLVQDLQDELEMKDSLTVKELAVEDSESQDTQNDAFNNGPLHAFSPSEKLNDYDSMYKDQKSEEESLSKIEAELEAELERLELNMSSSRLDRKISKLVELDADYVPDVVEGVLKTGAFARQSGPKPYAEQDGTCSSTTHSVHYAVSPRELTLRLHEVIQTRLEQRVQELEIALQNSQRKVQNMESQQSNYWRQLPNSESACCSTEGSPDFKEPNQADQPVVINLSGETLDADNEPFDEFTKINELEEADSPSGLNYSHKQELLQSGDQKEYWLRNSHVNYEVQGKSFTDKTPLTFSTRQGREDNYHLSNGIISSGDEDDIGYDGMEEILIKHIVEQARRGSPVVLNAQRALFSPDEDDHSQ